MGYRLRILQSDAKQGQLTDRRVKFGATESGDAIKRDGTHTLTGTKSKRPD